MWRIGSFEEWVCNPATSKPKSLAISLSQPCECWSRTSFLYILGLEVQPYLFITSKACKVPTSTVVTLKASSFLTTFAWKRRKAYYGSLGLLVGLYSMLKVEWMKDLASNSLSSKSLALMLALAQLASTIALSSSLVWPRTVNLWVRFVSSLFKLVTRDLSGIQSTFVAKGAGLLYSSSTLRVASSAS